MRVPDFRGKALAEDVVWVISLLGSEHSWIRHYLQGFLDIYHGRTPVPPVAKAQ